MYRYFVSVIGVLATGCAPLLHDGADLLRVRYFRFEPAPQLEGMPSTVLTVRLANESSSDLSRIVVRISVVENESEASSQVATVVAGPYTLIGNENVLRPGQTIDFELRLKNLSSECGCAARVEVLSLQRHPQLGAASSKASLPL